MEKSSKIILPLTSIMAVAIIGLSSQNYNKNYEPIETEIINQETPEWAEYEFNTLSSPYKATQRNRKRENRSN